MKYFLIYIIGFWICLFYFAKIEQEQNNFDIETVTLSALIVNWGFIGHAIADIQSSLESTKNDINEIKNSVDEM